MLHLLQVLLCVFDLGGGVWESDRSRKCLMSVFSVLLVLLLCLLFVVVAMQTLCAGVRRWLVFC